MQSSELALRAGKHSHPILRRAVDVLLGAIVFAVVVALAPVPVQAADGLIPPKWDVSGSWQINQSNGPAIALQLKQSGDQVTGSATSGGIKGTVLTGTVIDDELRLRITWRGTATVITKVDNVTNFVGAIASNGAISGQAIDDGKGRADIISWSSTARMKRYGEVAKPSRPGSPPTEEDADPTTPAIGASRSVVTMPADATESTTTIWWNSGSDHPRAEVWVKVDNQERRFVARGQSGELRVRVKAGKTYHYMLLDRRERLATVTVEGM